MSGYDLAVLGFYLLFMIGVGLAFRRFSSSTSDYFRGGGTMLWWMTGAATFMSSVSVWSFTGAAGMIYKFGMVIAIVWAGNLLVCLFVACVTAPRFRQMRVVTSVEAIRRRFGAFNEQFYVWVQVPRDIFSGGVNLMTLATFISAVVGQDIATTILVVGIIVLLVALFGGAWAVAAGGFVQMMVMLLAAAIVTYMSLYQSGVGGVSGLIAKLPRGFLDGSAMGRPAVMWAWMAAMFVNLFLSMNDMSLGASKYLGVKNGMGARKAAAMSAVGFLFLPILLVIPPLCTAVLFPPPGGLDHDFPGLKNHYEAAYVAVCLRTLPHGMLGLLVCGIFAAGIASMDAALNRNAGVIVRNFYHRVLKPTASDRELLVMGKIVTCGCGVLVIGIALIMSNFHLDLFDLVLTSTSLIAIPMILPLFWGLFIRATPAWAAWSTTVISMIAACVGKWVPLTWFPHLMGWTVMLNHDEESFISYVTTIFLAVLSGTLWFFLTMAFARHSSPAYRADVDRFFTDMRTPIDPVRDGLVYDDSRQYRVMGLLCLAYGSAMALGAVLIPNQIIGRMCFGGAGGVVLGLGGLLLFMHRRLKLAATRATPSAISPLS